MDFKQFYKTVQFDIDKEIRTVLQVTQGDTKSRGLLVPVVVNSVVTPITTETMNFFALKPDGTRVMTAGVKDGDKFRIDFTNQTFAVPGILLCALVLYGTNGEKIADKKFKMTVDSSLEDGAIISEDERGILDRAFDLASDIVPRLEALDVPLLEDLEQEVITARGVEATLGARLDSTDAQLNDKANKVQEEWITPTLLNGWEQHPSGGTVGFMIDTMGFVHLRGFIRLPANTPGSVLAFILPVGYAPSTYIRSIIRQSISSNGLIDISTKGMVTINAISKMELSLDSITFKAV